MLDLERVRERLLWVVIVQMTIIGITAIVSKF